MNNNADHQLDALFAAARQEPRDTSRMEWGFEVRLAARLCEETNPFAPIVAWAWRLCPFFAALAVAAGLWSRTASVRAETEAFLVAQATNDREEHALLTYFTGETR